MTGIDAEMVTRAAWEPKRAAMVDWLINSRKFNPKGAAVAVNSFIETQAFVAYETCEPQLGRKE